MVIMLTEPPTLSRIILFEAPMAPQIPKVIQDKETSALNNAIDEAKLKFEEYKGMIITPTFLNPVHTPRNYKVLSALQNRQDKLK